MAEFKKVCRICGKEFIAANSRYVVCSDTCRKINRKNYIEKNRESIKESRRKYFRKRLAMQRQKKLIVIHNFTSKQAIVLLLMYWWKYSV